MLEETFKITHRLVSGTRVAKVEVSEKVYVKRKTSQHFFSSKTQQKSKKLLKFKEYPLGKILYFSTHWQISYFCFL